MFELRRLSVKDGMDIYEMLQEIPAEENNMHNSAYGISFEAYKDFLVESEEESKRDGIIDGWRVPSTRYWLYVNGKPVGFAVIRHFLTPARRQAGGNIGYTIRPTERGRGYGKKLLELLLEEARKKGLEKVLITALPTLSSTMEASAAHTPARSNAHSRYPGSFSTVSILYMYLNRKNAGNTAASTYIPRILMIGLKKIISISLSRLFQRFILLLLLLRPYTF